MIIIQFQLDERDSWGLDTCLHVSTEPSSHVLHGEMYGSLYGLYVTHSDFAKFRTRKLGVISNYKLKLLYKRGELDYIYLLKSFLFHVDSPST